MNIELNCESEAELADVPEFNQDILNGLAYTAAPLYKESIDRIIYCASKSFPEGFTFRRSVWCSPQESFSVMSGQITRADRLTAIDMSPSDIRLVRYEFEFNGIPLYPRYLNMPVPDKGDLLLLAGKRFALSPVLADPGFSITQDDIFIRMTRAPVTFRREICTINKYDKKVGVPETRNFFRREADPEILGIPAVVCSHDVPWSRLHWKGGTNDRSRESDSISLGKVVTTMPHYLFARKGVVETFREYANCDVKLVTEAEVEAMGDEFDHDHWVLYGSQKNAPTAYVRKLGYRDIATNMMVMLPRNKVSVMTETLIAGMFYVLDHFPYEATPEMAGDAVMWRVWLGYILWGDQLGKGKLNENVMAHLHSLDDYVDIQVKDDLLNEENVEVDSIYDLFIFIIENMKRLIDNREGDAASMFGKRLTVVPYIMKDISEQIFKFLFEIINNRKRTYGAQEFNQSLGRFFSPSKIFDLRKTSDKAFVNSISTPGDNMYYKGTSRLTMQSQTGQKLSNSKSLNLDDPSNHLHPSVLEAGNTCVMQKSLPLAKGMINPCVRLDKRYTILPKVKYKELRDYVAERI